MASTSRPQSSPKISVFLLTYNHENYVRQALDSILMQDAPFDIELQVHDDFSTDGTRGILKEYEAKYPGRIKLVFNERNIGFLKTTCNGWPQLKGEYVTIMDGDDYWLSKDKLRIQVEIMDAHPEYVGTAHHTRIFKDGTPLESQPIQLVNAEGIKLDYTIHDFIDGSAYFHTSSLVYRNVFKKNVPKMYFHKDRADYLVSMMYAEQGIIHFIPQVMSAYRLHSKGVWSKLTEHQKNLKNLTSLETYNQLFGYKYSKALMKRVIWGYWSVLRGMAQENRSYWSALPLFLRVQWLCYRYFGAKSLKSRQANELPGSFDMKQFLK